MGKPERKQSEAAAGAGKLSLGPLIAKPGKPGSSAANPKQQLLAHPNSTGTAGSTNISGVKQLLSAKLAELDATLTSSAARVRDQLDKAEAALETAAKGHQAAAQQVRFLIQSLHVGLHASAHLSTGTTSPVRCAEALHERSWRATGACITAGTAAGAAGTNCHSC